ncbi:Glycosyl transferase family 2 [Lachnospiraceae bacterium KH1T2]|nr:Glycosyl transferase family 2 [Lachnospiraceae bacterium KH1T2]
MNNEKSTSRLEVLLSCMHLDGWRYIDCLNIKGNVTLINQCDQNLTEVINEGGRKINYISTTERGLSKSRNMALKNASAEFCIFADNDVCYVDDYEKLITKYFDENPEADIIAFFIERPERHSPIYDKVRFMEPLHTMKIFSPEVAFRLSTVKKYGLKMDELFGAGSEFAMGEENIFLFDALRAGLKILYVPVKIAGLLDTESTWFKGYNEKFFRDRGAGYYRMWRRGYHFLIWQFAIRKYKLYRKDISMYRAIRCMYKGVLEYERNKVVSDRR